MAYGEHLLSVVNHVMCMGLVPLLALLARGRDPRDSHRAVWFKVGELRPTAGLLLAYMESPDLSGSCLRMEPNTVDYRTERQRELKTW